VSGCPLLLEMLEKLENEPFSEFGWKCWNTIGFSLALAENFLYLGLININGIVR